MVQHWCCRLWASEAPIKIQVISVTDSVWCFRRPSYFACSYLVSAEAGVFAVDVGMDSDAEDFLEGMESVGIPPERLRAILLTHWHNDHSAGVLEEQIWPTCVLRGRRPALPNEANRNTGDSWLARQTRSRRGCSSSATRIARRGRTQSCSCE